MTPALAPPRIDAHLHFWRYQARAYPWIGADMPALARDRTPGDILPDLQALGQCAAVAVQARGEARETHFLLELADRHPWIAGVVGWEDLAGDGLGERLDAWSARPRLRGFRHQVQDEPDAAAFLAAPAFGRGVALLQQRQYVYELLVSSRQLDAAASFCARHDRHWLVLDHLGKPPLADFAALADGDEAFCRWRASLQRFAPLAHVVCKLSGLVTEADWRTGLREKDLDAITRCLDAALQVFGPQRLMFGSDWPVCLLAASYGAVYETVRRWAHERLSAQERQPLWGGTAMRCYGLQLPTPAFPASEASPWTCT